MIPRLLEQLPPPPAGKTGFPWTEETDPARFEQAAHAWPKISIVTPSYNQGHYLEETLRGILLQNYPNLELIVVDGNSTDSSHAVIERYRPFLAKAIIEPDKGQSDAIQKGLALATGALFNWINSDDVPTAGALLEVGALWAQTQAEVICGRADVVDDSGKVYTRLPHTAVWGSLAETLARPMICQPSMYWDLAVVRRLGGLNKDFHYTMDLELWVRYLLESGTARVAVSEQCWTRFRLHVASKTQQESESLLTSRFTRESACVYRFLAAQSGDAVAVRAFDALQLGGDIRYQAAIQQVIPPALCAQIAVWWLAYQVHRAFYKQQYRAAWAFAKRIPAQLLPESARADFRYQRRRSWWKSWF